MITSVLNGLFGAIIVINKGTTHQGSNTAKHQDSQQVSKEVRQTESNTARKTRQANSKAIY